MIFRTTNKQLDLISKRKSGGSLGGAVSTIMHHLTAPLRHREDQQYWSAQVESEEFPLFDEVLIETRTDCNRKCSFCPQSVFTRPLEVMSDEIYRKVIDDLADMGWSGRIALMVTNEPMLDKRMPELIKYAKQKSGRFFLDVNSNGNTLDSAKLGTLFSNGLDNINLDDYRPDRDLNPMKLSKNIEQIDRDFADNPKVNIVRRRYDENLSNRGGSVPKADERNPAASKFCMHPFTRLVIVPSGDVVLCCMDYYYKERFGNVMETDIATIWRSEKLHAVRRSLIAGQRSGVCAGCDVNDYPNFFRWGFGKAKERVQRKRDRRKALATARTKQAANAG